MGQNGRNRRDEHEWHRDRDRVYEDRSEGNRWGDHPQHDRNMQMQRDRFATGQSGYSAGRSGQDPSLDYQNRNSYGRMIEDRQVFGTDDRFTGRGGSRFDAERVGQRESYGDRNYDQSFGSGYRQGYNQNDGQGYQGAGSRDRGDFRDDQRGVYDHREDNRSFQSRDYGPSESERGRWTTNMQGPHRGKGPRGYTRSDERIKEMVCEVLTEDAHIDASGIDIEVKNGEVILSGMVPDRRMKRMAEDVLEGIGGIKDITNQIKVSDDERQKLGRSHQMGNQTGNGIVQQDETRKADDKKARA